MDVLGYVNILIKCVYSACARSMCRSSDLS